MSAIQETSRQRLVLKYRPDIDGLRAVAILSVFAFHLAPWRVPGGFVGVDVFFVISGYLISAIVFAEIAGCHFSVLAFYERRIRRIFPALFVMLGTVSLLISFFLLPTELIDYAKSVVAVTASVSNFYFWRHSGYFEWPTSKPLLHTWSLAVEEQFYIFFPLFLVLVRRLFSQWLKQSVLLLLCASLAASIATVSHSATTAFYMPYTRAWELLIGTAIALGFFPRLESPLIRNALTALGLAMIALAAFRFDSHTAFPGLAALIPCLGSALIIGVGESGLTFVGKALSWRPLVFIGLISYSLYLWHWPVIVLNELGLSANFNIFLPHTWLFVVLLQKTGKAMLVAVSFGLAILSWRFVERPFRSRVHRLERRRLFAFSAAMMALLVASSGVAIYAKGFPKRFPPGAVKVASFRPVPDSVLGHWGSCVITYDNQDTAFDDHRCISAPLPKETYLLLGDSHAAELRDSLTSSLPGTNVLLAAAWGCSPSFHPDGGPLCDRMMRFIFQQYLPSHSIKGLLVEARWKSKDLDGVSEVIDWAKAHGTKVVLFGPVAEYEAPLPRLLAYSIAWNRPNWAQEHRSAYSPLVDAQMRDLAEHKWHVPYISLYQATCDGERCLEYADETNKIPLLKDSDHLSKDGSKLLLSRLSVRGDLDCLIGGIGSE